MKLAAKQECFISEYLIDLNATQAAIRAGYSEKAVQEQSSHLLSNVMVQQAVSEAKVRMADKAEWSIADGLRLHTDITVSQETMNRVWLSLPLRRRIKCRVVTFHRKQNTLEKMPLR